MSTEFSRWLQEQLRVRRWSPSDFFRESGIPRPTIYSWVNGTRHPDPESIDKIADVFGLPVDVVLTVAGHRPNVEDLDPDDPRELLAERVRHMRPDEGDMQLLNTLLDNWDARNKRG
jgi:transcriptional regulator with XRE-family HTH domain